MNEFEFKNKYKNVNINTFLEKEHFLFLDELFQVMLKNQKSFKFNLKLTEKYENLTLTTDLSEEIKDLILKELSNISLNLKFEKIKNKKL